MLINEIDDCYISIKIELLNNKAHKGYLQEKLRPILWDLNILKNIIEGASEE